MIVTNPTFQPKAHINNNDPQKLTFTQILSQGHDRPTAMGSRRMTVGMKAKIEGNRKDTITIKPAPMTGITITTSINMEL